MSESENSDVVVPALNLSTKKRKRYGKLSDVMKKINLRSHVIGKDCGCKRYKCFENVPEVGRLQIIRRFNELNSVDEQNIYLCGLITVLPVKQRRPRKVEEASVLHDASYNYRIRFSDNGDVQEKQVCRKAFLAMHGIERKKLEVLQRSLKLKGKAPRDRRGKHLNRPHKLSENSRNLIRVHIKSFKGRKTHYSLIKTTKVYLPENLNVKKMFKMFEEQFPLIKVSYETYRTIFSTEFNIAFGFPRSDTCSECDMHLAKIKGLEASKQSIKDKSSLKYKQIERDIKKLEIENKLHKSKAEVFYKRKRDAKKNSQKSISTEAICLDYAKNVPVPNITTNDVYYKRQLSIYSFNIHVLSTSHSVFYMYPETTGNKGSDSVSSLLHHFLFNFLGEDVRHLEIFCDSCGGQNKNYTFIRALHYIVHTEKKTRFG